MTDQLTRPSGRDVRPRSADEQLRRRARAVIPGGMYGHQSAASLPPEYPQFMRAGKGARVWDVDGNEYVDLMCSYGPVVLGHRHPAVEEAARAQAELADCQNGPGAVMVELAELLVGTVAHADWAMFAKNGTDATTICCTIARARHWPVQDPRRDRRLSRRGAVVHAPAGRSHHRGPGEPRLLHLQRPVVRAGCRGRGWRRPGRDRGQPVQARRRLRPGAGRARVRPRAARALHADRRGPDPGRRPLRLPAAPGLELGASRRAARPVGLEQGHRQRPSARRRARLAAPGRRRREHLRDRLVLVLCRPRWQRPSRRSARCARRTPSRR